MNFAYGAEGEPLARTGSAEAVALTYTPLYQTKTLEDGEGNVTTYTYNDKGHLSEVAYPLADSSPYYEDRIQYTSYDRAGQVLGLTDGNNVAKTFAYGSSSADDGLLTQIAYTGYSGKTITLTYDDFNRLETVREPSGPSNADAGTFAYDDLDNVVEATRTYKGLSTKTFEYGFYGDGSRESMINAAGTWTYLYDENGECVELESPAGTATFSYLDNGWPETRTLPNGSYTEYEWNNLGLPKTLTNRKSDASVRSKFEDFTFDGVFNMTGMDTSSSVYAPFVGPNTWSYDTKDSLTSDAYVQDSGSSLNYSDTFAYDDSFNPTTFKGTTHGFDADNRRTSPGTFAYDGNGNPTTYNGVAMTYDLENRLTSTTSGTDAFDAGYRADGLRAWKAWNMVAPTQEGDPIAAGTYYFYDNGLPVLECNSSGTVTAINVFAPDGLVSRKQSGAWRHYQFEPQGSVTHRLRDNDTVISSGKYTAYGSRLTVPTAMDDPFGFNGRWGYYTDLGLELILCMHRYYDVATGRWLTRDPIGYAGGINLYGYCSSAPISGADPTGTVPPGMIWMAAGEWLYGAPPAPPGVDLNENINVATDKYREWLDIVKSMPPVYSDMGPTPPIAPPHLATVGTWFAGQVGKGGDWDYKGPEGEFQDYGNSHYGVVGCAAGFSQPILLGFAGIAHIKDKSGTGSGIPFIVPPFGDDPRDQDWIKRGIGWYTWFHGK